MASIAQFDWGSSNLAESFKLFQQRMELYFKVKKIEGDMQVPNLLLATGEEGLRRFNSWSLTEEQKKDATVVFKHFIEQLEPPENFRIARLKLSKFHQHQGESIDDFTNRCKLQAKKCDFSEEEKNERLIELIIASTPFSDLQKDLLAKQKGYKLQEAIKAARDYEASAAHVRDLQAMNHSTVAAIRRDKPKNQPKHFTRSNNASRPSTCRNCGRDHQRTWLKSLPSPERHM